MKMITDELFFPFLAQRSYATERCDSSDVERTKRIGVATTRNVAKKQNENGAR